MTRVYREGPENDFVFAGTAAVEVNGNDDVFLGWRWTSGSDFGRLRCLPFGLVWLDRRGEGGGRERVILLRDGDDPQALPGWAPAP